MPQKLHLTKDQENLALILFCVLILARNFILLIEGFGEPDAARLLNDAIIWSKSGTLDPSLTQYRARISPLYLCALKWLIDLEVRIDTIIYLMNAASAVAGALTFFIVFKFFRYFLPFSGLLFGGVVIAFAPSAFLSSIYGMPHTIGHFFFLCSLTAFTAAYLGPRSGAARMWWIGVPCLCLAAAIKADILLGTSAFLGVLIYARRMALPDLAKSGLWIAAGTLTPLLLHAILVPDVGSAVQTLDFAVQWNEDFTLGLDHLFGAKNILITTLVAGLVFTLLFLVSLGAALKSPDGRNLAILALLWILPVTLFWGLRPGNSARHLLPIVVPMALILAWAGARISETLRVRFSVAVATAAVAINYAWIPPMGNTVAPSTQILNSTALLQEYVDRAMSLGRGIETSRASDHVIIGTWTLPYLLFNGIRHAESIAIVPDGFRVDLPGAEEYLLRRRYVKEPEDARQVAQAALSEGQRVWTVQYASDEMPQDGSR